MAFKLSKGPSFNYAVNPAAETDAFPLPAQVESEIEWTGQMKKAGELVTHLPSRPGQSMHALMTGRYDLTALIAVTLDHYAERCDLLRATTLSFNSKNVQQFATMMSGHLHALTLLYSEFHADHSPECCGEMRLLFEAYPERCRLAAARCHCKVVTMAFASGRRIVFEGSANLRTNSNHEQIAVFNSPELHDWHAAWIDAMVAKHEQKHEGGESPAG